MQSYLGVELEIVQYYLNKFYSKGITKLEEQYLQWNSARLFIFLFI